MGTAGTSAAAGDGRHRRALRTRAAVADAVLALVDAGEVRPTAPQIAELAGVGIRTVYHHFDDLETLFAAVAEEQHRRIAERLRPIPATLPLPQRCAAFAAQRAAVLEAMTPIARASQLQEPASPRVQAESDRMRRMGVDDVAATFAPELDARPAARRRILLGALAAAASWRAWEAMRADHGLSVADATAALHMAVRALLTAADPDTDPDPADPPDPTDPLEHP